MPSKNETQQFKMLSDQALAEFRIFCAAGRYPRPDGAHDAKHLDPTEVGGRK